MHEVFLTEHVILSSEQWSSLTWGHFRDLWGSQFQLLNSSQILWLNALNVVPLTWLKIFRRINQISADFQYLQTLWSPCNKIMHLWQTIFSTHVVKTFSSVKFHVPHDKHAIQLQHCHHSCAILGAWRPRILDCGVPGATDCMFTL